MLSAWDQTRDRLPSSSEWHSSHHCWHWEFSVKLFRTEDAKYLQTIPHHLDIRLSTAQKPHKYKYKDKIKHRVQAVLNGLSIGHKYGTTARTISWYKDLTRPWYVQLLCGCCRIFMWFLYDLAVSYAVPGSYRTYDDGIKLFIIYMLYMWKCVLKQPIIRNVLTPIYWSKWHVFVVFSVSCCRQRRHCSLAQLEPFCRSTSTLWNWKTSSAYKVITLVWETKDFGELNCLLCTHCSWYKKEDSLDYCILHEGDCCGSNVTLYVDPFVKCFLIFFENLLVSSRWNQVKSVTAVV